METISILLMSTLVIYVVADAWSAIFRAAGPVSPRNEFRFIAAGAVLCFCGFSVLLAVYSQENASLPEKSTFEFLAGATALLVLTMHGALRVAVATSGERQRRARLLASATYWLVCAAVLIFGIASVAAQPLIAAAFTGSPWIWIFPLVATTGLFGLRLCISTRLDRGAFLSSSFFVAGLLCTAAVALFPNLIARVA